MIKILATSDWHLGNCFHGFDRLEEHVHFLDWLFDLIRQQQPDVLIVAGDVFDNGNPSAASQELYYSFLDKINLNFPHVQTVIIAGNHDSAARLEAPRAMLARHKVYVRGVIRHLPGGEVDFNDLLIPVVSGNGAERAWIIAVPYLREGDFPRESTFSEGVCTFFNQAIAYANARKAPGEALGLVAHLYATGAQIAEGSSERVIVGGTEMVDVGEVHAELAFMVLGHLHRRQRVGGKTHWLYTGSALPMSFAERNYPHGAVEFNLYGEEADQAPVFYNYELLRPLQTVPERPAPLAEVLELLRKLPDEAGAKDRPIPYLEVNLLLDAPVQGVNKQIEDALEGRQARLCRTAITYRVEQVETGDLELESVDDLLAWNPIDVIRKSYLNKHKCEMREELVELANQAVEAARKEEEL